jgi:hypothetical protein
MGKWKVGAIEDGVNVSRVVTANGAEVSRDAFRPGVPGIDFGFEPMRTANLTRRRGGIMDEKVAVLMIDDCVVVLVGVVIGIAAKTDLPR